MTYTAIDTLKQTDVRIISVINKSSSKEINFSYKANNYKVKQTQLGSNYIFRDGVIIFSPVSKQSCTNLGIMLNKSIQNWKI